MARQQGEVAEQGQGLIRFELGLGQSRLGEAAAGLEAAGLAGAEQLLEVPEMALLPQSFGLEGQTSLQETLFQACL